MSLNHTIDTKKYLEDAHEMFDTALDECNFDVATEIMEQVERIYGSDNQKALLETMEMEIWKKRVDYDIDMKANHYEESVKEENVW